MVKSLDLDEQFYYHQNLLIEICVLHNFFMLNIAITFYKQIGPTKKTKKLQGFFDHVHIFTNF